MTSELKIKANRTNSRASTGPRTRYGRTRSARNAFRHGLSLPVCSDLVLSEEVEALALEIAGVGANAEIHAFAGLIAEAQVDLHRIRQARHQLLTDALRDCYYDSRANVRAKFKLLGKLLQTNAADISIPTLTNILNSTPQGEDKLALILSEEVKRLEALERYERRALSRRSAAVEIFDRGQRASKKLM